MAHAPRRTVAAVKRRPHKLAHPTCEYGATTWSDCDKAVTRAKGDWDAFQQVLLAYRIALREAGQRAQGFKADGLFDQLVQIIRGTRQDFVNEDGNPHMGPWAVKLRAAIDRFKAGDFPAYNLYAIPGLNDAPAAQQNGG